jgi:hypothetical protein
MNNMVKLKGITKKGRERVQRDGELWRVIKEGNPPCFENKPSILLSNAEGGKLRWILKDNDADFTYTQEHEVQ